MTFRSLHLWLATLSSLIMPISASAINIPPPLTNILNSTITLSTVDASLILSSNPYSVLDKRQEPEEPEKPKQHWTGRCDRLNPGKHNCPLMRQACHMFFEQNWERKDMMRFDYTSRCTRYVCAQTFGDCFEDDCFWKCG